MKPHRVINLTRGYCAIISHEDYRMVNRYSWYTHFSKGSGRKFGEPYARTRINGKHIYMHRFIMDAKVGLQVDHRNNQTLDNRRDNLREVEPSVNMANRRRKVTA